MSNHRIIGIIVRSWISCTSIGRWAFRGRLCTCVHDSHGVLVVATPHHFCCPSLSTPAPNWQRLWSRMRPTLPIPPTPFRFLWAPKWEVRMPPHAFQWTMDFCSNRRKSTMNWMAFGHFLWASRECVGYRTVDENEKRLVNVHFAYKLRAPTAIAWTNAKYVTAKFSSVGDIVRPLIIPLMFGSAIGERFPWKSGQTWNSCVKWWTLGKSRSLANFATKVLRYSVTCLIKMNSQNLDGGSTQSVKCILLFTSARKRQLVCRVILHNKIQ